MTLKGGFFMNKKERYTQKKIVTKKLLSQSNIVNYYIKQDEVEADMISSRIEKMGLSSSGKKYTHLVCS